MNFNSPRKVAIRVSTSLTKLGDFFRKKNYFREKKIVIRRKGLIIPEYQTMDLRKHRKKKGKNI